QCCRPNDQPTCRGGSVSLERRGTVMAAAVRCSSGWFGIIRQPQETQVVPRLFFDPEHRPAGRARHVHGHGHPPTAASVPVSGCREKRPLFSHASSRSQPRSERPSRWGLADSGSFSPSPPVLRGRGGSRKWSAPLEVRGGVPRPSRPCPLQARPRRPWHTSTHSWPTTSPRGAVPPSPRPSPPEAGERGKEGGPRFGGAGTG